MSWFGLTIAKKGIFFDTMMLDPPPGMDLTTQTRNFKILIDCITAKRRKEFSNNGVSFYVLLFN